ncbi:MAG: hypothetical protein V2A62_03990 [Candidatus Woesearchaeota archaeon]
MDNLLSLEKLRINEPLLRKHIFTDLQLKVLKKKIQNQQLNSNEKTYYYKFIKPKVKALLSLSGIEERNWQGKEFILPEKIEAAQKILQQMQNKHRQAKIMLSGSFLFQKEYQDIDIFIFSKYKKEDYHWKKVHVTFLPETALNSLFFHSLRQISLSNFSSGSKNDLTISLKEILQAYELLVNEVLNKEDCQKNLRDLLLKVEYLSKNIILNPQQLYLLRKKFSKKNILSLLQKYLADNLALNYSKKELILLKQYIKDYQKLSKQYHKSFNLQYYIKTYQEVLELAS